MNKCPDRGIFIMWTEMRRTHADPPGLGGRVTVIV